MRMKDAVLPITLPILLLLIIPVIAQAQPLRVDFFYSPGCPHCATVSGYLESYLQENPGSIEIVRHDVSEDTELFIEMQNDAGIPSQLWGGVPKVFVGGYYCIGSVQCHEELLAKLDELAGTSEGGDSDGNASDGVNPYQIIGLAAVDAVNPCALAVLTLILMSILVQDPEKRRRVLTAGLSFTAAIFITYFFYGLVIVQLFRSVLQAMSEISLYLYTILGLFAVLLGILNIKDYFSYKPGGLATEMPMRMRPAVKSITSRAATTKGAFVIGILVTLFLLPCTIGPYIVTGGILAGLGLSQTIPWLLIYNMIFVLPMLAIVAIVYAGFTTVESVSGWKEKNIRYLHLVAGIVMVLIGLVLVLGFF